MVETPMAWEATLRLVSFVGVFASLGLAEALFPRRPRRQTRRRRWAVNLGLSFLDTLAVRLVFSLGALGAAQWAATQGWGLFNHLDLPAWAEFGLGLAALDLTIYFQHLLFHATPLFWRFHGMHHTDLDLDASSGVRFHPLEIMVSMGIKLAAVAALGAPAEAVVAFEVLLNAASLFNHANLYLPPGLDRVVRLFLVTPDMHRVHHSVIIKEHDSNFGFTVPWWDWVFGTYRAQPAEGHLDMKLGLASFRDERRLGLVSLLGFPFRLGRKG